MTTQSGHRPDKGVVIELWFAELRKPFEDEVLDYGPPFMILDVSPGITLAKAVPQGDAVSVVMTVGIGLAAGISANMFTDWLHDKLSRNKPMRFRVNGHDVEITQEAITQAITTALSESSAGSASENQGVCPYCGSPIADGPTQCEGCAMTRLPAHQVEEMLLSARDLAATDDGNQDR